MTAENGIRYLREFCLILLVAGLIGCGGGDGDSEVTDGGGLGSTQANSSNGSGGGSGGSTVPSDPTAAGADGPTMGITAANWRLPAGHYVSAKVPLQILQPFGGLDTRNRFYKAYPGVEYRVKAAVRGGAFPYFYELTTAPAGMVIDSITGEILWSNPAASAMPYNVTLRVEDQEGSIQTVSWTVTVTTAGFIFVDAVNGNDGNDGSFANPYRTLNGWYKGDKFDNTHQNDFVYYMSGTYQTRVAPIEDNVRMACVDNNKPLVHMAYPGETPVIDVQNSYWIFYDGSNSVYFQGLTWENIDQPTAGNMRQHALVVESTGDHVTVYRNTFNGGLDRGLDGQNTSMLFASNANTGMYWAIQNNRFNNALGVDAVLAYDLENGLIAENLIDTMSGSNAWGFYIKISNKNLTLRQNSSIGNVSKPLIRLDSYTTEEQQRDLEVCYNNGLGSARVLYIGNNPAGAGRVWSYRNTWRGGYVMLHDQGGSDGPFDFERDVVMHNGAYAGGFRMQNSASAPVVQDNLLIGTANLVDGDGNLMGSNRTNFLGTHGHEVSQ